MGTFSSRYVMSQKKANNHRMSDFNALSGSQKMRQSKSDMVQIIKPKGYRKATIQKKANHQQQSTNIDGWEPVTPADDDKNQTIVALGGGGTRQSSGSDSVTTPLHKNDSLQNMNVSKD